MLRPLRTRRRRRRRESELDARAELRFLRRLADQDVTVFGEELTGLHVATLTTELSEPMLEDYQAALGAYEAAGTALAAAGTAAEVRRVDELLVDGRFRLACVLARRDGRERPQRRPPCFFNPQHGPATHDVDWTPPAGVERPVPVCFRCRGRLTAGEQPDHRLVRVGDRWVSWWAAGGTATEVAAIGAHVVRGDAWHSRIHQAEAMTRAGIDPLGGWTGGSGSG